MQVFKEEHKKQTELILQQLKPSTNEPSGLVQLVRYWLFQAECVSGGVVVHTVLAQLFQLHSYYSVTRNNESLFDDLVSCYTIPPIEKWSR